jgi:hypothetical protein
MKEPVDRPVTPCDLSLSLPASGLGHSLGGISDKAVRQSENSGELFSIQRPGRSLGREYPALQPWSCMADGTLAQVLAELGAPSRAIGADVYGFFTSPTDMLGGLTPIETLLGSLITSREVNVATLEFLDQSPEERRTAVFKAAEAYAADLVAG